MKWCLAAAALVFTMLRLTELGYQALFHHLEAWVELLSPSLLLAFVAVLAVEAAIYAAPRGVDHVLNGLKAIVLSVVVALNFFSLAYFKVPPNYSFFTFAYRNLEAIPKYLDAYFGLVPALALLATAFAFFTVSWWLYRDRPAESRRRVAYLLPVLLLAVPALRRGVELVRRHDDGRTILSGECAEVQLVRELSFFLRKPPPAQGGLRETVRLPVKEPVVATGGPSAARPNVLFVLNESFGTEHLAVYTPSADSMPLVDAYLGAMDAEGRLVAFKDAITNSSATDVSMPSLFTGVGPWGSGAKLHSLPLAWDWARAAGYATAYLTAQDIEFAGLRQFYRSSPPDALLSPHDVGLRYINDLGADETEMAAKIVERLAGIPREKPFFVVYNTNAMHVPFQHTGALVQRSPARFAGKPNHEVAAAILDDALASVVNYLERSGRLDDTLIVLTADHAEYLNDDFKIARVASFDRNILHIPLVFVLPKAFASHAPAAYEALEANAARPVQNLDLLPTLIDFWGARTGNEGLVSEMDGASLLKPVDPDRIRIALSTNEIRQWVPEGFGIYRGSARVVFNSVEGVVLDDGSSRRTFAGCDGLPEPFRDVTINVAELKRMCEKPLVGRQHSRR